MDLIRAREILLEHAIANFKAASHEAQLDEPDMSKAFEDIERAHRDIREVIVITRELERRGLLTNTGLWEAVHDVLMSIIEQKRLIVIRTAELLRNSLEGTLDVKVYSQVN